MRLTSGVAPVLLALSLGLGFASNMLLALAPEAQAAPVKAASGAATAVAATGKSAGSTGGGTTSAKPAGTPAAKPAAGAAPAEKPGDKPAQPAAAPGAATTAATSTAPVAAESTLDPKEEEEFRQHLNRGIELFKQNKNQ